MNCLYCGKMIADIVDEEKRKHWHIKCIKSFFGTNFMPKLEITSEQLEELANLAVNHSITVPGVQKKLSLNLVGDKDVRLTIVDYPAGYILKPQSDEFKSLPEFEHLAMNLAVIAGIKTVPNALIIINNEYAYITKRIDREIVSDATQIYAMEDFCQLSLRQTQDKYRGSYESCGRIIKKYSAYPGLDLSELFIRVAFSFIIGNSDMHLKNFSLRETEPANRIYKLSQAYDMLPVNIILPEDTEQMALTLNGKKSNIRKKDFDAFAESCSISAKSANAMIKRLCSLNETFLSLCDNSYISDEFKDKLKVLITQRIEILAGN